MNTFIAVVVLAIAAVTLFGVVRMIQRKKDAAQLPLYVKGLASRIGYNKERMDRTSAKEIASELFRVKKIVWPELLRIYETGIEYPIDTIIIDPAWVDPMHHAGIKAYPRMWHIRINPMTRWGGAGQFDYRNAFAGELHSVLRVLLYGTANYSEPFDEVDKNRIKEATQLWQNINK